LRNPDLKNILGLYVTNKGVEIIPVKNSYFPQVKAYNLAEERDVFAINVLFRYLTLNGHPPIRNLDYSVAESFWNSFTSVENNTIIEDRLYLKINGDLIADSKEDFLMEEAVDILEKNLNISSDSSDSSDNHSMVSN